jgi:hypothetical protein
MHRSTVGLWRKVGRRAMGKSPPASFYLGEYEEPYQSRFVTNTRKTRILFLREVVETNEQSGV